MNSEISTIRQAADEPLRRVVLAVIACLTLNGAVLADEPPRRPVMIRIEGVITAMTQQYVERKLEAAQSMGSNLIIVEIDSPGGVVEPSFAIAERLRDLNWARTVAFVPREALSGAAFVALGCQTILIGPNARIGDAGPIVMGEDSLFRHAPEKIVSDLAVRVRQLAEAAGRPPGLAEAMVKHDLEVFETTDPQTGQTTFMTQAEIADQDDPQRWERGRLVFESRPDHFLEVTGERAVELGLADENVDGMDGLQAKLGLERPPLRLAPTWVDTLVFVLNHPAVTVLLLVMALVFLYIELHMPGIGIAGILSAVCFGLFFWSRFLGGTSGWLEIVLFLLGVGCLMMELFVIPGFGVMGVSGILLIVGSFILASQSFVIPQTTADFFAMGQSLRDLAIAIAIFAAIAAFMSRYFQHLPFVSRMILKPADSTEDYDPVQYRYEEPAESAGELAALSGQVGVTKTPLRPAGKMTLADHRTIDVVAEGAFVAAGCKVRVLYVQGNRVVVREVEADDDPQKESDRA